MARTKSVSGSTPRKKKKKKSKGKKKNAAGPSDLITELVSDLEGLGGEGTAQVLGSDAHAIRIRGVISTQCKPMDDAIGRGGIPLGRLTVIHGKEGSGKTTGCLHLVAETQAQGGIALYIDKEYKLDPDYAQKIGVDIKRLIISQPPYLERVFDIIKATIEKAASWRAKTGTRVPILIILDSMNSAIAKAKFEGDAEDKHMAVEARVYSQELPRIIPLLAKEDVALVFVSQYRTKFNVMFGDPNEIAGGNAPKFYASLMLKYEHTGKEKDGDEAVASQTKVTVMKNQIAPPFRVAEFDIRWGIGIDKVACAFDAALHAEVIDKSGSFFSYDGRRLGQGRSNVLEYLREQTELLDLINLSLLEAESKNPLLNKSSTKPKKSKNKKKSDKKSKKRK